MKFYYNGELVRTSKNHVYTHAVITERGGCIACSSSKDKAEAVITTARNNQLRAISNMDAKIEAIKAGKKKYRCVEGRRTYYLPTDGDTVEQCEEWKQSCIRQLEWINHYKVVELEAR